MDYRRYLIPGLALALTLAACTPRSSAIGFEQISYADSTDHAYLTMDVELPVADGKTARAVRAVLVDRMDQSLSHADTYEEERAFPRFDGDADDTPEMMAYYQERTLRHVGELARSDYEDRVRFIRGNAELSASEKDRLIADSPKWSYTYTLEKIRETDHYLVFDTRENVYMGGAHGGIVGAGALTFDKADGHLVTPVLRPDCIEDIQPLLVRGLMEYFREMDAELTEDGLFEMLMLEQERQIPLPVWDPYPAEEGLVFTYQQYEIASYAAGMPAFVIPFADVRAFLSVDAEKVFGLQ